MNFVKIFIVFSLAILIIGCTSEGEAVRRAQPATAQRLTEQQTYNLASAIATGDPNRVQGPCLALKSTCLNTPEKVRAEFRGIIQQKCRYSCGAI